MRKTTLLALTAVAATAGLATAVPASAATRVAYRYSTSGLSAEAFYSDAPYDFSTAAPGTTYHDTYVSAGQQETKSDGTVSNGNFVLFDQVSYSFDSSGNFTVQSESFGYADGAAVGFTETKKLTSASLRATVPTTTCDASFTCTDGGSVSLALDWTGAGDLTHQVGNFVVHNRTLQINSHQNGYFRNANASGLGQAVFADMFSGKYTGRCAGSGC
ncbi:MAG: hypothetical protein ACXVFV_13360 [Mycobacteriales bacterium]